VASRYTVLHPSVIATIADIVATCRQTGKAISICGEAAANPQSIFLFLGMGADHISMTPSAIPMAKNFIRSIRRSSAEECLCAALEMEDAGAVAQLLKSYFRGLSFTGNILDAPGIRKSDMMAGMDR